MPTPQDQDKVNLMKEPKLKITQRNLPHWELDGSVYFITFNTWEKGYLGIHQAKSY
jgi:hypothetical protein